MEILMLLVAGAVNVACFVIGAKVGQAVAKGEKVTVVPEDPFKAIREREDRQQSKAERERLEIILKNIDSYDGTGYGQQDVPIRGE